jgi:hypothetical protein
MTAKNCDALLGVNTRQGGQDITGDGELSFYNANDVTKILKITNRDEDYVVSYMELGEGKNQDIVAESSIPLKTG